MYNVSIFFKRPRNNDHYIQNNTESKYLAIDQLTSCNCCEQFSHTPVTCLSNSTNHREDRECFWRCIFDHKLLGDVIKLTDVYKRTECAVQCGHRPTHYRMVTKEQFSIMIKHHLGLRNFGDEEDNSTKWTVQESPIGGRGLFATKDIKAGEVLFIDYPLVYGPRSGSVVQRGCSVCKKIYNDTFYNCFKCALLLCSEQCQNSGIHLSDCSLISCWSNKVPIEEVDDTLLSRALTPIRALLLNEEQKYFLTSLQANDSPKHGSEIRNLKQYFDIPTDEEEFMILVSHILNTNAFQMATPYGKKEISWRGLYPVASIMNHNCVPNTRNCFNVELQMTVKASNTILAGSEIYTCYTGMLWGSPSRRLYLHKSKLFLCNCQRCSDPTEGGTLLAALKCFFPECTGSLLPVYPLKVTTAWRCSECGMRVPYNNICVIQSALGSLMGSLDFKNVAELEHFYLNRISKFIPKTNQIAMDLQCRLIWELGETEGVRWNELSESQLSLKENLCRDTLRTLAALDVGDAHLRGLLLYHLHAALAERARRYPDLYEELKSEIESTIEQACNILQDDISAPPDLELRRQYLGPGCDKPHRERFFILDATDNFNNVV